MSNRPSIFARPGGPVVIPTAVRAKVGFDFPTTLQGHTAHFNVYYNPALSANGQTIAAAVLTSCEREYNSLSGYFGGIKPPSFNVIIHHPIPGAYHWECAATDLYCDAQAKPVVNADYTRMLVVAEEVEVYSALQGLGWDCGASNGEGLSRVLATEMYPAELNGFASAATWLDSPGRPDFININDPTDTNFVSTGCSVLFLNYLRYQLGHSWQSIVQAGRPTLAQTYRKLGGSGDPLTPFKVLLQTRYPEGKPSGLGTDNPFPI